MTIDYAIGGAALATAGSAATAAPNTTVASASAANWDTPVGTLAGTSEQGRQLLASLYEPTLSTQGWLLALALAALLGGLHALTPGHGKTLVAAYLVGSRGTPGHAVLLGATVTVTHTASVFAVGLLVLLAGSSLSVNALTIALELGTGLLVLLLGARLLWHRGRAALHGAAELAHGHDHDHSHGHPHDHHHNNSGRMGLGSLMALGVSGGLTPCPEALGVMLVAVSLGRVWQGLGLILAFSLGLAVTIIALGLALVLAGSRVRGLGLLDRAWVRLLPLGSAALITLLGGVMTARGLLAALGVTG